LFLSRHFINWTRFDSRTSKLIALQSDVIRNILLFNYGGLWLDTDAVPLRDLWDITAGVGLQFIPKFERGIANGHVMHALCPKSPLARRRLESMMLFPIDHPNSWPRRSTAFGNDWVFNDALSEQVRASQALKYNLPLNAEDIDFERVPAGAWLDLEVPFPIAWFDNWWACHGLMRARNNGTDFLRKTACNGAYIYHRLTKHIKGDPETWGPNSGGDQFWDEIYGGPAHDYKAVQSAWSLEPVVLTGGASCP
jgi:Glycosyltransferase sugar-binding region containing DXD motif